MDSPPSSPAWAFPFGPSSKYHQRERSRSYHSRIQSSYFPTAPTLSTDKRAHRRVRSAIPSTRSPPASDPSSSARSPLSRFSSYTASTNMAVGAAPVTPAKPSRAASTLQDSPFSDYFTDDARSVQGDVPSPETQQLLVRLQKLQSQLIRHESDGGGLDNSLHSIGRKLDEIEDDLNVVHPQTRQPPDIGDSGLFMDDTAGDTEATEGIYRGSSGLARAIHPESEALHSELVSLSNTLHFLQLDLAQRYAEVRDINERHAAQLEARDAALEHLRAENKSLRAELGARRRDSKCDKVSADSRDHGDWQLQAPDEVSGRSPSSNRSRVDSNAEERGMRTPVPTRSPSSHQRTTQTTERPPSPSTTEDDTLFPDDDAEKRLDMDCAITTSSEDMFDRDEDDDEDDDDDEEEQDPDGKSLDSRPNTPSGRRKTAWRELCDSLANWTGMGEERFD